jgi:hypothetical protein
MALAWHEVSEIMQALICLMSAFAIVFLADAHQ